MSDFNTNYAQSVNYEGTDDEIPEAGSSSKARLQNERQWRENEKGNRRARNKRAQDQADEDKKQMVEEINRRTGGAWTVNRKTTVVALRNQIAWLDDADRRAEQQATNMATSPSDAEEQATYSLPPSESWMDKWNSYPPEWFTNNTNQDCETYPSDDDDRL
ncbi:hypothetical protein L198_07857 [Cryptococcus wingfieldii CBS 7118]|uniref:Uncharacterized protein n=1 Tax=Cryptococcus wingfieldii CBS 7118 TaxID=1295528 RepID=A0A1E3HV79_9TREE|nr:hypothetical protein L198_07857 [Cryptococcus wingfieldii CBS 7118]ODN80200.1 hypothetical protein L198_07857 [Cryptococcus wingfieldii CBS 7118]